MIKVEDNVNVPNFWNYGLDYRLTIIIGYGVPSDLLSFSFHFQTVKGNLHTTIKRHYDSKKSSIC